jgi:hypothetical protein
VRILLSLMWVASLLFFAGAGAHASPADLGSGALLRVDCGWVTVGGRPKPFRLVVKAVPCRTGVRWLRNPASLAGFKCAASAYVCWKGPSFERATAFLWAFPVQMVSRARAVKPAAREIASRFIRRFGIYYPASYWTADCRIHRQGVPVSACAVRTTTGQCSGKLDLYRRPDDRFDALATRLGLDLGCAE